MTTAGSPRVASSDLVLDDEQAQLRYAQARVELQVVERVERLPGVTEGGSFVLVDLASFEAATDRDAQILRRRCCSAGSPGPRRGAGNGPRGAIRRRS